MTYINTSQTTKPLVISIHKYPLCVSVFHSPLTRCKPRMQNFEPESAVISASSNSALIEKYLRNTCLGQGAVPKTPQNKQTL